MKIMKNLMIITVIVSILLTFGCSKGGGNGSAAINNTPVEQIDPNVLAITNSTPDRAMIKEIIKNEVIKKVNEIESNNKAPRKATGDTSEVYFALSKSTVEINENSATNKYRFLYEDFDSEWTGELIFLFSKDGNGNWVNTDYGAVFKPVDLCLVKGNIINNVTGKPMEGVVVYGLSGSEGTRVIETEQDGSFMFDDIFDEDYVFHFVNPGFKKEKTETISIVSGGTNEIETVYMTPDENERFATVEGTAYYDNEKTRPVDDGVVYLLYTDGKTTDIKPVMTDQNGEYRLRFVSPGLYDLRCKYGDLVSSQNVIIIEEYSADDLKVVTGKDIVIGSNNLPPELVSYSPTQETIEVQVGDKIDFKVEVQDPENDKIYYNWVSNGGIINSYSANSMLWVASDIGNYKVKCTFTDKKNKMIEKEFYINVISTNEDNEKIVGVIEPKGNMHDNRVGKYNIVFPTENYTEPIMIKEDVSMNFKFPLSMIYKDFSKKIAPNLKLYFLNGIIPKAPFFIDISVNDFSSFDETNLLAQVKYQDVYCQILAGRVSENSIRLLINPGKLLEKNFNTIRKNPEKEVKEEPKIFESSIVTNKAVIKEDKGNTTSSYIYHVVNYGVPNEGRIIGNIKENKENILLVHGIQSFTETLGLSEDKTENLQTFLEERGFNVLTYNYNSFKSGFYSSYLLAYELEKKINDYEKINIMCHSKGGLVTRGALRYLYDINQEKLNNIGKIYFMSNPHKGGQFSLWKFNIKFGENQQKILNSLFQVNHPDIDSNNIFQTSCISTSWFSNLPQAYLDDFTNSESFNTFTAYAIFATSIGTADLISSKDNNFLNYINKNEGYFPIYYESIIHKQDEYVSKESADFNSNYLTFSSMDKERFKNNIFNKNLTNINYNLIELSEQMSSEIKDRLKLEYHSVTHLVNYNNDNSVFAQSIEEMNKFLFDDIFDSKIINKYTYYDFFKKEREIRTTVGVIDVDTNYLELQVNYLFFNKNNEIIFEDTLELSIDNKFDSKNKFYETNNFFENVDQKSFILETKNLENIYRIDIDFKQIFSNLKDNCEDVHYIKIEYFLDDSMIGKIERDFLYGSSLIYPIIIESIENQNDEKINKLYPGNVVYIKGNNFTRYGQNITLCYRDENSIIHDLSEDCIREKSETKIKIIVPQQIEDGELLIYPSILREKKEDDISIEETEGVYLCNGSYFVVDKNPTISNFEYGGIEIEKINVGYKLSIIGNDFSEGGELKIGQETFSEEDTTNWADDKIDFIIPPQLDGLVDVSVNGSETKEILIRPTPKLEGFNKKYARVGEEIKIYFSNLLFTDEEAFFKFYLNVFAQKRYPDVVGQKKLDIKSVDDDSITVDWEPFYSEYYTPQNNIVLKTDAKTEVFSGFPTVKFPYITKIDLVEQEEKLNLKIFGSDFSSLSNDVILSVNDVDYFYGDTRGVSFGAGYILLEDVNVISNFNNVIVTVDGIESEPYMVWHNDLYSSEFNYIRPDSFFKIKSKIDLVEENLPNIYLNNDTELNCVLSSKNEILIYVQHDVEIIDDVGTSITIYDYNNDDVVPYKKKLPIVLIGNPEIESVVNLKLHTFNILFNNYDKTNIGNDGEILFINGKYFNDTFINEDTKLKFSPYLYNGTNEIGLDIRESETITIGPESSYCLNWTNEYIKITIPSGMKTGEFYLQTVIYDNNNSKYRDFKSNYVQFIACPKIKKINFIEDDIIEIEGYNFINYSLNEIKCGIKNLDEKFVFLGGGSNNERLYFRVPLSLKEFITIENIILKINGMEAIVE